MPHGRGRFAESRNSYKNVKRGGLDDLWQKTNVLHPRNLLQAILSEPALNAVRRELRKDSGVLLSPEEVISGVRRLLNETALAELENVRISIPERKRQRRKRKAKETQGPASESGEPGVPLQGGISEAAASEGTLGAGDAGDE